MILISLIQEVVLILVNVIFVKEKVINIKLELITVGDKNH
jgi:hypothetical protein